MILSPRHHDVLASFATSNVLLAFDYDGTLAPIVATPERARMRERTRRLLAEVAQCYPCVVISGRTLADVSQRLDGVPVWYTFGNHGFEPSSGTEQHAARVRDWVARLQSDLPRTRGLVLEPKRYSATIHYRHVRSKPVILRKIEEIIRELPEVRAIGGSDAINLLPSGGPNKGIALQQARRLFACDTAIYVGDDETDEDAFRSAAGDRLLAIRVGTRGSSAARYRLRSQKEMDRLLLALVELRTPRRRKSKA
jgi:trehalose 6-phosphate phosphatase